LNIELMTLTHVERVEGEMGRFTVTLCRRPRYVDMDKCIACGECTSKCPKVVQDGYNEDINHRKAIYVGYPQAVPLKYQIDPENCLMLLHGRCGVCEEACPAGAVRFNDKAAEITIQVGSMILAPGYRAFDPSGIRAWGYGTFPNVVTSMEFERYLSASGPTEGNLIRPSDGKKVKKIAFLQCVGSRDYNEVLHVYCSSLCCMFALKEAMIAMDHAKDLDVSIFFMDMRAHGKDFERYLERAKAKGVKLRRCRVHSLEPSGDSGSICFRYVTDDGRQVKEEVDLVVLSVGIESRLEGVQLAECAGIELNHNRFAVVSSFSPVSATKPGIYVCGAFSGPKDIPQSVTEASAAAAAASIPLSDVRFSLSRQQEYPAERDVRDEAPRIGVFICHCGSNIAGVIDVATLGDYAATLPHVAYVERALFTCAQDTQEIIRRRIEEKGLNRLVIAACTPRTHEGLFRETLRASGLNEYLFEMANIRNQVARVHAGKPEAATAKAMDLVRMAVAKVALLGPLAPVSVRVNPQALVIGGGVAGMVSALGLADQGFPVHLVERSSQLGGNGRHLFKTWKNEPIQDFVEGLVARVRDHDLITVHMKAQVTHAEGFIGNFRSTITKPNCTTTVEHGAAILATGGQAYKPSEYGYQQSRDVLTALEFDKLHLVGDERVRRGLSFVFVQCVGSREPERPYCSRVCCTHSVQAAITLKEEKPERNVFILYRDMRTYGQREELYKKARELGVIFINYEMHRKPDVRVDNDRLDVVVFDHVLHEPLRIPADMVVLATAIVPSPGVGDLANLYKAPVDADGFLQEAHAKLRPVDSATDGLFLAGVAHYPKPMEEVVAQAYAAVARTVTVLSNRVINLDSIKAMPDPERCDGCALCLDVCPYHAISLNDADGAGTKPCIAVNAARCKGCGICQATCPKEGVEVGGFSYRQLSAQVKAAVVGK
jgi:heterodisulfide reductase subunit A2